MLAGQIYEIPDGCRGVDVNSVLDAPRAASFFTHGYRFAVRYIRRAQYHQYDLSADEADTILRAGLGLVAVQHVESAERWVPSAVKGIAYGSTAAKEMSKVGFPAGAMVWCDLEGVAEGTNPQSVIDYCNQWAIEVSKGGYLPGLYVGWHAGLTADELYYRLKVARYWSAYNLNADEVPSVRGVCVKQHAKTPADVPTGIHVDFDVDVAETDAKGNRALVLALHGLLGDSPSITGSV